MLVAASPASNATSKVLNNWVVEGGSGWIKAPKTSQNGKLPKVISQTLLKAFCNKLVSIVGMRAMRFCRGEEGMTSMLEGVFKVALLSEVLDITADKSKPSQTRARLLCS